MQLLFVATAAAAAAVPMRPVLHSSLLERSSSCPGRRVPGVSSLPSGCSAKTAAVWLPCHHCSEKSREHKHLREEGVCVCEQVEVVWPDEGHQINTFSPPPAPPSPPIFTSFIANLQDVVPTSSGISILNVEWMNEWRLYFKHMRVKKGK